MVLPHAKNLLLSGWIVRLKAAAQFRHRQAWGVRGMAGSAQKDSGPWMTATPRVCLHDVPTTLKAGGLTPHSPVTLSASLTDENGKEVSEFRGWATHHVRCNCSTLNLFLPYGSYKRGSVITYTHTRFLSLNFS